MKKRYPKKLNRKARKLLSWYKQELREANRLCAARGRLMDIFSRRIDDLVSEVEALRHQLVNSRDVCTEQGKE